MNNRLPDEGAVTSAIANGIATVEFGHPKSNSLPGTVLRKLANEITAAGKRDTVNVVALRSMGDGPFCAGASFDELVSIQDPADGQEFFLGFARVILAMIRCRKPIVTRVQGKVVGGGVGLVAASDYVLATEASAIRLSELAVGIGPFVVGPVIERKVGSGAFGAMALDADWRTAAWALNAGLYAQVYDSVAALDSAFDPFVAKLAKANPEATARIKSILWQGTDEWDDLLDARAQMSGRLVLSDYTKKAIETFKGR